MPALGYQNTNSLINFPFLDNVEPTVIPKNCLLDFQFVDRTNTVKSVYISRIVNNTTTSTITFYLSNADTSTLLATWIIPFSQAVSHYRTIGTSFVSSSSSNFAVKMVFGPGIATLIATNFDTAFTADQTEFSPSTVVLYHPKVETLVMKNNYPAATAHTYGNGDNAIILPGSNVDAILDGGMSLDVFARAGTGLYDGCNDGDETKLTTINAVAPNSDGTLFIQFDNCYSQTILNTGDLTLYSADLATYEAFAIPYQSPSTYNAAVVGHSIIFQNNCQPKCPPENLNAFAQYLNRIRNGVEELYTLAIQTNNTTGVAHATAASSTLTASSFTTTLTDQAGFEKYFHEGRNITITYSNTNVQITEIIEVLASNQVVLADALTTTMSGATFKVDDEGIYNKINDAIVNYNTDVAQNLNTPYGEIIYTTTEGTNSLNEYGTFISVVCAVFNPTINNITFDITFAGSSEVSTIANTIKLRQDGTVTLNTQAGTLACKEYATVEGVFFIPCGELTGTLDVSISRTWTQAPPPLNVTDTVVNGTQTISVTSTACSPETDSSTTTVTAIAGTPFTFDLTGVDAGSITWNAGDLPSWASTTSTVPPPSGVHNVYGTPDETSSTNYLITSTLFNDGGSSQFDLLIKVVALPVMTAATVSPNVAVPFLYQVVATNNPTSYTTGSGFPPGLSLNSTTGVVSGTPTTAGTYTPSVTVTNLAGTDTKTLTFHITVLAPVIISSLSQTLTKGVAFSYNIIAQYSPTSFGASGLPTGLSINTSTGLISGTPSVSGSFSATITATNGTGTDTRTLVLQINTLPPVITSSGASTATVGTSYSYQIVATNSPTSYHADSLPSGLTYSTSTGLITGTPTAQGNYSVTLSATNAAGTGTKTLSLLITSTSPSITSALSVTAVQGTPFTYQTTATNAPTSYSASGLPSGLSINTSSGTITGTVVTTGSYSFTVTATNTHGSDTATIALLVTAIAAPAITSSLSATLYQGFNGGYQITASNFPTSYNATSLPSGLSVDTATGLIYGTPSGYGSSSVTISATNGAGTTTATLVLSVTQEPPLITSPNVVSGFTGDSFTYSIVASNTPTSYNATGLPSWASVNTSTGVISGIPDTDAVTVVTLSATNGAGTGNKSLSIDVGGSGSSLQIPVITSDTALTAYAGSSFSYTIVATNTPTSYGATDLPTGVSRSGAVVSGTIATAGEYFIIVSATNTYGGDELTVAITVLAPPVITSVLTASVIVGNTFSYQIIATNSPTSYGATSLPATLSISSSTGAISGTATDTAAVYNVTISATNAAGTTTATLVLTLKAPIPIITSITDIVIASGGSISYQITATNTPTSYGVLGRPTGVLINTSTGLITGSYSVEGTYTLTLQATNGYGTGTQMIFLHVYVAPVILGLNAGENTYTNSTTVGFGQTLSGVYVVASGSPTSWSISSAPPGITIDPIGGGLTGTPTAYGTFSFSVTATNIAGSSSGSFTLIVPPLPVFTSTSSATVAQGTSFAFTVTATNNPFQYSISNFPSTFFIDAQGSLTSSGISDDAGVYTGLIAATNVSGIVSQTFTLTITQIVPLVNPSTIFATSGSIDKPIIASYGPITAYAVSGLPSGLVVNTTTGHITGSVSSGSYSLTVTATNATGTSPSTSVLLDVGDVPVITIASVIQASLNNPFSLTLTASNSPTFWYAASGLPPNLYLSGNKILGIPTAAVGFYAVTGIVATNSFGGSIPASFTLQITASVPYMPSQNFSLTTSEPFSYNVNATGLPTSYAVTAGTLPTGLSLNTTTGLISGTPTGTGTYSVTIGATNTNGTGTTTIGFFVDYIPFITSTSSVSLYVDTSYSNAYAITATNSPVTFSISSDSTLPYGLSLDTSSGVISGYPYSTGLSSVTVQASNSLGTGSLLIFFSVTYSAPVISIAEMDFVIGTATPVDYSHWLNGTNSPTSYSLHTGYTLPSGLSLNTITGYIIGTPTGSQSLNNVQFDAVNAGGTGTATVAINVWERPNVSSSSNLTAAAVVGTSFTKTFVATISSPSTVSGWNSPDYTHPMPSGLYVDSTTGIMSGTPYTDGVFTTTVQCQNSGYSNATASFSLVTTITCPAPSIGTTSFTVIKGQVITTSYPNLYISPVSMSSITANNSITVNSGMPSGLSINSAGYITGTVTASQGLYTVSITLNNSYYSTTTSFTIQVYEKPNVAYSANYTLSGTEGSAVSQTLTGTVPSPSTIQWSWNNSGSYNTVGYGLNLDYSTGIISGTPQYAGTATFTVTAINVPAYGSTSSTFNIVVTITAVRPNITSANHNGIVGQSYYASGTPTFSTVNLPATWSASGLPAGLSINTSTGVITGVPTTAGTYAPTITADNTSLGGGSATTTVGYLIYPAWPTLTSANTATITHGVAFSYTITTTGSPAAFELYSPSSFPSSLSGLSLNTSTGVISGTVASIPSPSTINMTFKVAVISSPATTYNDNTGYQQFGGPTISIAFTVV